VETTGKELAMSAAHHSEESKHLERFLAQLEGRARRNYSEGRVGPHDEGDLAFAIAVDPQRKIIIIDFGKPVDWIGMPLREAVQLREMLTEKIKELQAVMV